MSGAELAARRTAAAAMVVQAVSEPYPDRGRSVLVRVYVDGIPRGVR